MAPRLLPFFRVEGATLYSAGSETSLSAVHAAILQRCSGEATAREIAQAVIALPESGVRTEGQVYGVMQAYAARGIISWMLEIPYCLHPERNLREMLEKIEKEELRRPMLEELEELEQGREKVNYRSGMPSNWSRRWKSSMPLSRG